MIRLASLASECLDDLEQIILGLEELKPESREIIEENFQEARYEIIEYLNRKLNK